MPLDVYSPQRQQEGDERAKYATLANALDYAKGLGASIPGDIADLVKVLAEAKQGQYPKELDAMGTMQFGEQMGADTESGAFMAGTMGLMPDLSDALMALPLLAVRKGAKAAAEVPIEKMHMGHAYGQDDYLAVARNPEGDEIGRLSYSVFEDRPHINHVEVGKDYRGKGIGSQLVESLTKKQHQFDDAWPYDKINWGYTTDDGTKLKAALDAKYKETKALPMDEASRMARAKEMGFDTDVYHGTNANIDSFSSSKRGTATKANSARRATWLVDDPRVAETYADFVAKDVPVQNLIDRSYSAERRGKWDEASRHMEDAEKLEADISKNPQRGQNILPLNVRGKKFYEVDAENETWGDLGEGQVKDWLDEAEAGGYEGLKINNLSDNADYSEYRAATHYAVFDPKNIRSRHARFDPSKKDSANLMAGAAGGGLLAALMAQQQYDRSQ